MPDYRSWESSTEEKLIFFASFLAGAVFLAWLFYDEPLVSPVLAAVLLSLRPRVSALFIRRRQSRLLLQFKDLLYSLSSLMTAGRSLAQGLSESQDFWQGTYADDDLIMRELGEMDRRMREGGERELDLIRDLAIRSGSEDIADFALACETCKRTGGDFAGAVSRCAEIIGDKIVLEKELTAMAAQKRFEGRIIGAAPLVIIFFIRLLSPDYMYPLYHTQSGRMVSTLALVLIGAGFLLLERMNEIEF